MAEIYIGERERERGECGSNANSKDHSFHFLDCFVDNSFEGASIADDYICEAYIEIAMHCISPVRSVGQPGCLLWIKCPAIKSSGGCLARRWPVCCFIML